MVVSITDLAYTKSYDDLAVPTEAIFDAAFTSIQTHINDSIGDNLQQLAKDCFGATTYTFTSDAVAARTNNLFNKQYATDYYNGGDISIGTAATVAWAAVDAVNASIAITPEVIGQYRAVFTFNHRVTSSDTTLMVADIGFRITDGTTASYAINSGGTTAATGAGAAVLIHPVTITCVFDWATTTAKTVTLQYYNRSCTAVAANVVNAAAATGEITMVVEKI